MTKLNELELANLWTWANSETADTVMIKRSALKALVSEITERREVDRNLLNQRKTGLYTRSRRGRR